MPENTIKQINNLLEYFNKQELNLNKIENIKEENEKRRRDKNG